MLLGMMLWAATGVPAAEDVLPRLLVMPLEARVGVPANTAQVMGDLLGQEARKIPGYTSITKDDIEQLLSQEMRSQMAGCNDQTCLVDIAGALRADEILYGSVGRLGPHEVVLTLTRLDPHAGQALGGDAERLSGPTDDTTLDRLTVLLHRLYPAYTLPPPRARGLNVFLLFALMGSVGAVAQYAALASVAGSQLFAGWLPLYVGVLAVTLAVFAAAPLYVSFVQAYLLDQFGKRQAGLRWPALLGAVVMGSAAVLVLLPLATGAAVMVGGAIASFVYTAILATEGATGSSLLASVAPAVLAGTGIVTVGSVPGLLLLVVGGPLAQAGLLYFLSERRPVDAEPVFPTLWSAQEARPAWIPKWIPEPVVEHVVGGMPVAQPAAAPPPVIKQELEEKPAETPPPPAEGAK